MSQVEALGIHRTAREDTDEQENDGIDDVLGALADLQCRMILSETSETALSASEVSERCDMPQSTAYRKIDQLQEAGLLEERTRLGTNGNHSSEYTVDVQGIEVTVDEDNGVDLTVTTQESGDSGLHAASTQ